MPARSKAQFAAMQAAKEGRSTLGIPADVGAEFVDETPNPKALPKRAPGKGKGSVMADVMRKKRGK